MDAFEKIVASILDRQGFWTRTEVKVDLTKQEKRDIGRPSSPRWELDVVGYKANTNEIRVVECKSYLDSGGVAAKDVIDPDARYSSRFKLFHEHHTREIVFGRLGKQLQEAGLCQKNPKITLGMAAGNVRNQEDLEMLQKHFESQGWIFLDPESIRAELRLLGQSGYENSVAAVTTKMLLR
jgi:hypothetical protein